MRADPNRDRDNNRKYESGYQKRRKKAVKRKESEVLQQCDLVTFLRPANIEKEIFLSDESKHSEVLSKVI
jgi:hypothetical protein